MKWNQNPRRNSLGLIIKMTLFMRYRRKSTETLSSTKEKSVFFFCKWIIFTEKFYGSDLRDDSYFVVYLALNKFLKLREQLINCATVYNKKNIYILYIPMYTVEGFWLKKSSYFYIEFLVRKIILSFLKRFNHYKSTPILR